MIAALAGSDKAKADELSAKCKKFDKFEFRHIELEAAYNAAHEAAVEAVEDIKVLAFELEKTPRRTPRTA